jgi:predicted dehydrogenase
MHSSKVRFGIVGVGRVTRKRFAPALLSTEHAVLLAAASRDRRQAEALGPQRAYDSYPALLRDPDVDAVYIATHNGLHKELVLEALRQGKHVLCEKPLGCTAAECEEMLATANATQRLLMEAFMYRYHPQIRRAQELVQERVIGELMVVEASFRFHLTDVNDVRLRSEWGGGALLDVGCYCVNFARLFLGDAPRDIRAWATMDGVHGVDTSAQAVLKYESGKHAALSCGFESGLYQRAALVGTEGVLELNEPFITWARPPRLSVHVGETEEVIELEPVNTFQMEIEDFCTAIQSGTSPLLKSNEGLLNARVLDRIAAAATS